LTDGSIIGFEALARWRRFGRELVHPDEFIALAEETGMMVPIGREVLRQACTRAVQWASFETPGRPLEIAVNLSLTELRDTYLVDDVAAILRQTGLDPTSLILEVTESTAMRDPHATIATMRRLR